MFNNIGEAIKLAGETILVLRRYPVLLAPLMVFSAIILTMLVYLRFFVDWNGEPGPGLPAILVGLSLFIVFPIGLVISSAILVEFVYDIESGKKPHLKNAVSQTLTKNLPGLALLSTLWLLLEVVVMAISILIGMLTSKKSSPSSWNRKPATSFNIAAWLMGVDSKSTLSSDVDYTLAKIVRMVVFLIIPGIVWEKRSAFGATSRAWRVGKKNFVIFISGMVLSEWIATAIFLPPALLFIAAAEGVNVPIFVWDLTVAYCVVGIACRFYLEQMFTAEMFLWHKKYEHGVEVAERNGKKPPISIAYVARPKLMDGIHEFSIIEKSKGKITPLQEKPEFPR